MITILENDQEKRVISKNYNYLFKRDTGFFARWGATKEEDPQVAPAPEILDLELSSGNCIGCRACYKSNQPGKPIEYMTLETFKTIFHKLPRTLCQIAFGITTLDNTPFLWDIADYCRNNDYNQVVPNITINGKNLTDEQVNLLATKMGAVAVSFYDKDDCFGAVKRLTDAGLKQTNIHMVLCQESYDKCFQLLHDIQEDKRLEKLNAAVFLLLKPKGERNTFTQLRSLDKYKKLIDYALDNRIPVGFDSCSCGSYERVIKGHLQEKLLMQCGERCESSCMSLYIDVNGTAWPCSFSVDEPGIKGVNLLKIKDFDKEVWNGPEFSSFRDRLLSNKRSCPLWDLEIR